jgi:hypothetical protein
MSITVRLQQQFRRTSNHLYRLSVSDGPYYSRSVAAYEASRGTA